MNQPLHPVSNWLLGFFLLLSPFSASAEDEADPCPSLPRSGTWTMTAGNMSVAGEWTPLGGGSEEVTIKVINCGELIEANTKSAGKILFNPYMGSYRPVMGSSNGLLMQVTQDALLDLARRYPDLTAEQLTTIWWDSPEMQTAIAIQENSIAKKDSLGIPPEGLTLFETNVYKADFRRNIEWYLDYVNQYEMYSVVTSAINIGEQLHQQFQHWVFKSK